MVDSKQREVTALNMVLLGLAVLSLGVAVWSVFSDSFRAGTDDVFLVLVCLMLALLFAIPPLMWAHANGMLKNPFAEEALAEGGVEMEVAHGEHGGSDRQNIYVWGVLLGLTAFENSADTTALRSTLIDPAAGDTVSTLGAAPPPATNCTST